MINAKKKEESPQEIKKWMADRWDKGLPSVDVVSSPRDALWTVTVKCHDFKQAERYVPVIAKAMRKFEKRWRRRK